MLQRHTDNYNEFQVKLIDFGHSEMYNPPRYMTLTCGSLHYIAPEVLNKKYTNKCDLWSLGIMIYTLL